MEFSYLRLLILIGYLFLKKTTFGDFIWSCNLSYRNYFIIKLMKRKILSSLDSNQSISIKKA